MWNGYRFFFVLINGKIIGTPTLLQLFRFSIYMKIGLEYKSCRFWGMIRSWLDFHQYQIYLIHLTTENLSVPDMPLNFHLKKRKKKRKNVVISYFDNITTFYLEPIKSFLFPYW